MLSGDNSILSRATQAKTKTGNAQDEETISLAYLAAVTGKYAESSDMSTTLQTELEKTYGSGKVTVKKNETNNSYEVAITGKGTYTIDANGKVEKQGPAVTYANERIVTSSDGTGTTVAAGTKTPNTDKLYIYFEASVEGGTTSITPSVPFEITENGTYNFTITSTVNGENFTTTHQVIAKQYAARAGIKVGDYITYTSPTASVTFNGDETGYSSYSTTAKTLNRKTLFRVMDIDSEGNMELMGAMTSDDPTIYFSGAQGYNNAVSVLNNKCSELYKDTSKRITARSINEEDITKRFNSAGKKKMTDYIDSDILLNKHKKNKKKLKDIDVPISTFITQNKEISINNLLIKLINKESDKLIKKEQQLNQDLKKDISNIENEEKKFEEYSDYQKVACKKIEMTLTELQKKNKNLIAEEKKYRLEVKLKEYEIYKILVKMNLFRFYAKFANQVLDGDPTRFEKPIISDEIELDKINFEPIIKEVIDNYSSLKKYDSKKDNKLLKYYKEEGYFLYDPELINLMKWKEIFYDY